MKWMTLFITAIAPVLAFSATRQEVPKLTLSATATILKPADELQMKIGVVTVGLTAEETLAENSGKMRAALANLEMAGLSGDDYETSQFSIRPTYTPYPQNPPCDWSPSINGYEVTNSIHIHTGKLDLAGQIIDLANKAGANSIADIQFGLRSSRAYRTEVLAAASANAMSDAQAIAAATGVRLVRVLSISLNHTQERSPQINLTCLAKVPGMNAPPPIEPGDVSIEANVSLVYEID